MEHAKKIAVYALITLAVMYVVYHVDVVKKAITT